MRSMGCSQSSRAGAPDGEGGQSSRPLAPEDVGSLAVQGAGDGGPLRPPFTRRKDIFPPKATLEAVDDYASKAPVEVEGCLETLSAYLGLATRVDLLKARAFFTWIVNHIRWSPNLSLHAQMGMTTAQLLQSRCATASSYCLLFQELCRRARIPCGTVGGLLKDLAYDCEAEPPSPQGLQPNHAWNLVFLCGDWRFVDTMLGSAFRDRQGKVVRQPNDFYFLTKPEDAIQSHLPLPAGTRLGLRLQLLAQPLSLAQFHRRVQVLPPALQLGLDPVSHRDALVLVQDTETIELKTQRDAVSDVLCDLVQLGEGVEHEHLGQRHVICCLGRDSVQLTLRPPAVGRYLLDVLLQPSGLLEPCPDPRPFHPALLHRVRCLKPCSDPRGLPLNNGRYGAVPQAARFGLEPSPLQPGCRLSTATGEVVVALGLVVPALVEVSLVDARRGNVSEHATLWHDPSDGLVRILASLPEPGFYRLAVSTEGCREVVACLLESLAPNPRPRTFPGASLRAILLGCRVLEPPSHRLPAHSKVTVRLEAPRIRCMRPKGLVRRGDVWEGEVSTGVMGSSLFLLGVEEESFPEAEDENEHGLFVFDVL